MKIRSRITSIRTQIIVEFFLLIFLSIGAFMLFSFYYTRSSLEANAKRNTEEMVEQVNFNIENYIDYMVNISQGIMGKNGMMSFLLGETGKRGDREMAELEEQFQNILTLREDICNIVLLANDGRCFINSGKEEYNRYARLESQKWYQKAKASGNEICISSSHVQNIVKGRYDWVITMSHGIEEPRTGEVGGMLLLDLKYNVISDLCESIRLGKRGYVYIVDADGNMVYHPQQQLILSNVKEELLTEVRGQKKSVAHTDERGEEKLYTPFYSKKTGWTIVGVAYKSELVENEDMVRWLYLVIAGILILVALLMAIVLAGNITRPVKQLQKAMDSVRDGDFSIAKVQVHGTNEIYKLQDVYNQMVARIDELIQKNMHEEEEKRKIELKALQSQINPHFLYNTLDSIIWMVESEESDRAVLMTSALAKFFRQVIGKADIFVPLREELEYTKNYLIIQKMRYEDKIDYKLQVEEGIMESTVLKLVLQPLVENALYHGLKYKESKGMIEITGYRAGEDIVIKVSDNGIGMERQVLAHIFDEKPAGEKHNGVGLGNIKRRMQLYYGERCEFKVESERNLGTTITMKFPEQEGGVQDGEV